MWQALSHADLDAAKQQLRCRREETLRRHAEEIRTLETDTAELGVLEQRIRAFFEKFSGASVSSISQTVASETSPDPALEQVDAAAPGVSFFITQAQKARLRELGISNDQIREMKPAEAHRLLGLAKNGDIGLRA